MPTPLASSNEHTAMEPLDLGKSKADTTSMSEARQGFGATTALLDLLQGLSLVDQASTEEQDSVLRTTGSGDTDKPLEPSGESQDQGPQSSSTRSSLDFSFSSLHISAEEWESIDQDASRLLSSEPSNQPQSLQTKGDGITLETLLSVPVPDEIAPPSMHRDASEIEPTESLPTSFAPDLQSVSKQARFKYSPSVLAHHANTSCEKMLYLKGEQLMYDSVHPKSVTPKEDNDSHNHTTLAEATMARGVEYEARLQATIVHRIDCEAEHDNDSFFRLATSPDGATLCQPIFSLDSSFYTDKMRHAGIMFGRFIPDFIRVLPGSTCGDGTRKKRLFIIDAKSSSHVKISHQFQVTLYAIFLDHLIKLNGQEHLVEIDVQGGVWIPAHKEPELFSLAFMRPIVERFIFSELPAILEKPRAALAWHIDDPCLQCEFLSQCKVDAYEQKTLSLVPLLSKKSATWIKSLFRSSSSGSTEIEDLEDLVRDRTRLAERDQASLTKVLGLDENDNSPLLASFREKKAKVLPVRTMELPRQHQDRLFVNIVTDPMALMPFAYSLDLFKEQSINPSRSIGRTIRKSLLGESALISDQIHLATELIDNLFEYLVQVSEIRPKPPVLSIFFYHQSMRANFNTLLLRVVSSPADDLSWTIVTRSRATDLLANMFEGPDFLTSANIKLPDLLQLTQGFKNINPVHDRRVFTVEVALRKLLALPVTGSYSFKDVLIHLVDVEAPAIIDDKDRDDDGYSLSAIYHRWVSGASSDSITQIVKKWAEQQNIILLSLYALVRHSCDDLSTLLLAPQMPFKLRKYFGFKSSILSQFAFFQEWEAITLAQRRRQSRISLSKEDAMHKQDIFRCRFLDRHTGLLPNAEQGARAPRAPSNAPSSEYVGMFEVTSRLEPGVLVGETFKRWILTCDTPSGQRDRMRFDDMGAIMRAFGRGSPAIVSVPYYDPESKTVYISGAFSNMTESLGLTAGEHYILERREFSPTLGTSMDRLTEIDRACRLFLPLMMDPNKWGLQRPEKSSEVFLESITNTARQYDMTLSQEQAFTKVINNRLQIIWGPPGSGKTHFLALTILRLIDILRSLSDKGKGQGPQTIVITAFTHTAINNLVMRVAKLHADIAPHMGSERSVRPLVLYRLGNPSSMQVKGATVVEPTDLAKLQRSSENDGSEDIVRVVCGTVWQIRRASHPKTGVDYMRNIQMLVVDEGSQLLAADSIHAIECLDPERGRLVVAGDHLQLGPVILGEYPASMEAIDPTGSIMKNLMRTRDNKPVSMQWIDSSIAMDVGPCTSQLQENFRMNHQLGSFMQSIYGPSYKVQTPNRALPYTGEFRGSSFPAEIRRILDPSRSAVCIELQLTGAIERREAAKVRNDSRAAAYLEATFVAGIIEYYLEMVGQDTVTTLFVAVPHHVQRLAVLDRIRLPDLERKYPAAHIKVDTIEKLQGQEADLVVVCFALFDEFALVNELGYLYSVHRWVVALSRARCKTVVLMSSLLKSPKIMGGTGKANPGDLESLDGWGLLQAYEKYAESLGGKLVWPIGHEFLQGVGMADF